ncbi:MAG: helix-turn-helix transcriptional regulator [Clostridia bacterium]|nr:helix-turn-helix transcriptional regulator [Clostridia bacterium]
MTLTQAVIARTNDLLNEKRMTKRQLAKASNLSEGTIASIYKQLAKSVTLSTLQAICDGFGMSMIEFLDCKYFTKASLTGVEHELAKTE